MTTNSAVPSGSPAPAQAEGRPTTVNASFWLYILAAVVGIVLIIIAITLVPAATASVANRVGTNANVSAGMLGGVATGVIVAFGVIEIAIFVIFGILMRGGRNWARIVLIVIGALTILNALPKPGADYGVSIAQAVIILIALVLSVLPASNAWFRQMKASRMSGQMMPPQAPPQA